jgi:DNA-binding NtrC family response regulator
MNDEKVLLLDFYASSNLGSALLEILTPLQHQDIALCYERADFDTEASPDVKAHLLLAARHKPTVICLLLSRQHLCRISPLLEALKKRWPQMPIIAVAEVGEPLEIFELFKHGITDFITPPLKAVEILPRLWRLLQHKRQTTTLAYVLKEKLGLSQLAGASQSFISEVKKIPLMARCDASVLITGETGTGKELCARAIHYLSPRAGQPFVPVNCGAIPIELMENELFGHERGAFTGAVRSQPGLIHSANTGTLFLDEVDSMPLAAQVKLLRFIQEKEYRPLGSGKTLNADVRIIAATNNDCAEMVRIGKLRQDIFYRLNVLPLKLPPLRERRSDIPLLAQHFLVKYASEFDRSELTLDEDAMFILTLYEWPGNVRELENVIARAVALSEEDVLHPHHLGLPLAADLTPQSSFQEAKASVIAQFERTYIQKLMLAYRGNISRAAQAAHKNRRAFWQLMRKHKIDVKSLDLHLHPE